MLKTSNNYAKYFLLWGLFIELQLNPSYTTFTGLSLGWNIKIWSKKPIYSTPSVIAEKRFIKQTQQLGAS